VWGWSDAGEKITIRLHNQVKSIKADKGGNWKTIFDPEPAGGPFEFEVSGRNSISLKGVLVGEVWICSDQSNMEFAFSAAMNAEMKLKLPTIPIYQSSLQSGSQLLQVRGTIVNPGNK
jgi:sialate O-acetylesterase